MTFRDELDEVLADARLLLDAELSTHRPPPDVRDVMQRAREMGVDVDEQPAPESEVEDLELALEPDPTLVELNADARLLLDGLLERRPASRRTRWRNRPRRSVAAAAALVLLGLTGAAFANKRLQELDAAAESNRWSAAAMQELDHEWLAKSERAQLSARVTPNWIIPTIVAPEPDSTALPAPAELNGPDVSSSLELSAKLSTAERLALLDEQAYALLRAGQYEQATRRFRTIVEIGGRSEYAELAFGELFALARRDKRDDGLDNLWPAYLKRFPSGRYADAARAGLCRRTPEQSQRACWTDYLLEHPHGAARSEALRETQDD
jgi:hypothetical protein